MKSHEDYMRIVLKSATNCDTTEVPVAAMVVMNGEIIGQALNERESRNPILAHAELLALERAAAKHGDWNLSGATIYVTLEPCAMCSGAMLHARVERVVYGAPDPKTGAAGSVLNLFASKQINHQTTVDGGIMSEECGQMLRDFFKGRR